MRESGVREVLIYYADYKCTHHITMNADRWERRPLSRLKQGFDYLRERQRFQRFSRKSPAPQSLRPSMDRVSNGGRPLALYNHWAAAGFRRAAMGEPAAFWRDHRLHRSSCGPKKSVTPQQDGNSRLHYTKKRSHFHQPFVHLDRPSCVSDFSHFGGPPFEGASQGTIAMPRSTPSF